MNIIFFCAEILWLMNVIWFLLLELVFEKIKIFEVVMWFVQEWNGVFLLICYIVEVCEDGVVVVWHLRINSFILLIFCGFICIRQHWHSNMVFWFIQPNANCLIVGIFFSFFLSREFWFMLLNWFYLIKVSF